MCIDWRREKTLMKHLNVWMFVLGFFVAVALSYAFWGLQVFLGGVRIHHGLVGAGVLAYGFFFKKHQDSLFGFGLGLVLTDIGDFPWL